MPTAGMPDQLRRLRNGATECVASLDVPAGRAARWNKVEQIPYQIITAIGEPPRTRFAGEFNADKSLLPGALPKKCVNGRTPHGRVMYRT
jgi:hypothetical protein